VRKLVCFDLGGRELAASIDEVRETVDMRPITPVFRTPPCVAGITNLRGEILAVLDVALLLGLPPSRRDPSTRILVVDAEPPDDRPVRSAGLLVDRLGPIRDIGAGDIVPVPVTMPASEAALLEGIVPLDTHPLAVLDLHRVLDAPSLAPFTASDEPEMNSPRESRA